jgi:hypothetical protein
LKDQIWRNLNIGLVTKAMAYKGVGQEGSRECENGHSHSQVSSHFGGWSLSRLPNFQRAIVGVKTHHIEEFFISLKRYWNLDVLNWARMTNLDIWNTSYGQKKGQESNCQFDSRPLKVRNRPDFFVCKWRVTHCWKAFDEGYNFASELIMIESLHTKL